MMNQEGKIKFKKESKLRKILTTDVSKAWLVMLLIVGIMVLFSAGEHGFFEFFLGIGIIIISIVAMIFGRSSARYF